MKFKLVNLFGIFIFLSSFCCGPSSAHSYIESNVWDVLRSQLMLNHEVTQSEVQTQLRWLIAHPSYLDKLAGSKPYIYHIVTEIKKRNLPGELALIPMIESAYDPFAYSGAGAAGLWQLMPGTGNDLGLKQDWWFDGRRSIRPSTDAALNYLTYLHKFFNGNWILAIAAYDSGEGTVARAIKNSYQYNVRRGANGINFWSLSVPQETKAYVPRLLALAEIIQYPERYKITLPNIPDRPYFEEVNIGSQIDLTSAARLAGISYKDLIKLNPGYNRWATAPYKPFKLLIPADKVAHFNYNLSQTPEENRVSWERHQVRNGDSLASIARRYFTTTRLIRELNQLKSEHLALGQNILIPTSKNTHVNKVLAPPTQNASLHSQPYKVIYIVQKGDDYQLVAKKYAVSILNIKTWNNIKKSTKLTTSQQLVLWKQPTSGVYIVKAGDNLSNIAKKNNLTIAKITQINPMLNKKLIKPGQSIRIG